jgi:hypothetical protein
MNNAVVQIGEWPGLSHLNHLEGAPSKLRLGGDFRRSPKDCRPARVFDLAGITNTVGMMQAKIVKGATRRPIRAAP